MPEIELLWDADCPNVDDARDVLRAALTEVGLPARWTEWRSDDPAVPERARSYGSPTVLIDRRDVAGDVPSIPQCCRVYPHEGGRLRGVPRVASVVLALRRALHATEEEPSHA